MELDHGTTERRRIIVSGVVVEVEGDSDALRDFTEALREQVPALASVEAIELEWLDGDTEAAPYDCRIEDGVIRGPDLIAAALPEPHVRVALSGGTFQNLRLLGSVRRKLASLGFGVLTHRSVPPNDGGISFGQAAIAARRVD